MQKIKVSTPVRFNVPLANYTTFRVGGPADALAEPVSVEEMADLLAVCSAAEIPVTVLGGGANVVVSDRGIRGMVMLTTGLRQITCQGTQIRAAAGTTISEVSAFAAERNLQGLEFIYAMPGTTGGAVWMNARCYDGEIAAILTEVTTLPRVATSDAPSQLDVYRVRPEDFAYKISPFQDGSRVIIDALFQLTPGSRDALWEVMRAHEEDRRAKGHFDAPCAGSIFKNNRDFGAPSGQIIDRAGLRGTQIGGARISDGHGNIIVNTGNATARDIRKLVELVQRRVLEHSGFALEPEVLFPGEW